MMYDTVGELRFGVGWIANGLSRINLVAARRPERQGDEPTPVEQGEDEDEPLTTSDLAAVSLVSAIAGGADAQGQLLADCAIQLSVPGIGYILLEPAVPVLPPPGYIVPSTNGDGDGDGDDGAGPPVDETWTWTVLSQEEIRSVGEHYEIQVGRTEWRQLTPDNFVLIKVWRPHPRISWLPDSPCRAVLPVLRQINLLDEHVYATAQSRLAGAGLLIVPSEAEYAPIIRTPETLERRPPEDLEIEVLAEEVPGPEVIEDDFTEVLIETMTVPIGDRTSAAAVVPLVIRIPGEFADRVKHITFWSEFAQNLLPLRNNAVERLALGLDMPPEVLTGMSDTNHWNAWLINDSAVTLHIEPMAETICHALTVGYLRPALEVHGVPDAESFMVWYDATDLTTRPDRSADALQGYDRFEVSGAALRREAGLMESDAPTDEERRERILLSLIGNTVLGPTVLDELGLLSGGGTPTGTPDEAAPPPTGEEPDTGPPPGPPPAEDGDVTAALLSCDGVALFEACDGLVHRALERAGMRLRSAAGRKLKGGAAAVTCGDPARLHVELEGALHFADIDHLLANAWTRVPDVAVRLSIDPVVLTATLDNYTRALLATGHAHDADRLRAALGLQSSPV